MNCLNEFDGLGLVSEKSVEYILRQAARAECLAHRLFLKFSELFSHISEVSIFWAQMAQDEEDHAGVLLNIQKSLTDKQLADAAEPELLEKIEKVLVFLGNISPDSIETLDDACELAHELEFSEINTVFKVLASEFVSNETRRQATLSQLGHHIGKLMHFTDDIGDRDHRKEIAVKHPVHQN
ncbi:MAG: hypothetical protein JW837_00270 [Sedimentisphaerales bacterium]|nr:hypothetical protein [Sedimentisphaerales bacterium]